MEEYKNKTFEFLSKPVRISDHTWDSNVVPFLTISCITYNHEKFIKTTIEGFLRQETTFPVEIIIHDDASTDRTAEIIREYELKYPNLFKAIYQLENQYSKGIKMGPSFQYPRARGEYYASCEGDDYWIDPMKSQLQVDFLEKNRSYSMTCGGFVEISNGIKNDKIESPVNAEKNNSNEEGFTFTLEDQKNRWLTKTLTIVFRTEILVENLHYFKKFKYFRDTHFIYFILKNGKGFYFRRVFGAFNVHEGGVNSTKSLDHKYNTAFKIQEELYNSFPDAYNSSLFLRRASRLLIWNIKQKKNHSILELGAVITKVSIHYLYLFLFRSNK